MKGWTSIAIAIGYRIGNNIAVVAKLEVISVRKLTEDNQNDTPIKISEIPSNKVI